MSSTEKASNDGPTYISLVQQSLGVDMATEYTFSKQASTLFIKFPRHFKCYGASYELMRQFMELYALKSGTYG